MSDAERAMEDVLAAASKATQKCGVDQLRAENSVIGDACEFVAEYSEKGDLSKSEANALADALADELARYNKTDITSEFDEVFVESGQRGTRFNEVLENRIEDLNVVHSTDAKQGTVWRWHFNDGVKLETQMSKDGGRKHNDWKAFKQDYFDALVALGEGEDIADPKPDLQDSEDWTEWVNGFILQHATPKEHVGPRTEAVRQLRDFISRNVAYLEMEHVRDRQGVWIDDDPKTEEDDAATDGGASELRIPTEEIKRICDQVGISTRALQIELDARGLTRSEMNGVSSATYIDGKRVPYWSLDASIADPEVVIAEPETPAEQVAVEEKDHEEENRTAIGAIDGANEEPEGGQPEVAAEEPDENTDEDYEPGMMGGFGTDPDTEDDDERD